MRMESFDGFNGFDSAIERFDQRRRPTYASYLFIVVDIVAWIVDFFHSFHQVMAYVSISHFLPMNERQKKRKKLHLQTYQDPKSLVPCMSTFRSGGSSPYLGWLLHNPSEEVFHTKVAEVEQTEKENEIFKNIGDLPSNLRNYENTVGLPRFFEPDDFKDTVPIAVCYTYRNVELLLSLGQDDSKAGFSVVTTAEGCEINHITPGL